jgi:aldehyde dehydrogenase (NAD+)
VSFSDRDADQTAQRIRKNSQAERPHTKIRYIETCKQGSMKDTPIDEIRQLIHAQRAFFRTGQTKDIPFRIRRLKKLREAIRASEEEITRALFTDLRKSPEEAFLTEFSLVYSEIDLHLSKLAEWAKDERVSMPLYLFPSKGRIMKEPLGCALIMAPWNYPFQLLMNPLVGAISAGCCAIVKPSPDVPSVSLAMDKLIRAAFDESYIGIIHGGKEVNQLVLKERFDKIFFTGSPTVGRVIMRAAAEHLTPVTLELGGKSPCIVDKDANISVAAKRIAWGKATNAGQTCIAPDYLFVHSSVKDELLKKIGAHFHAMYGSDIRQSPYFGRMVTDTAFERVNGLMQHGNIIFGGGTDAGERYIEPTIIDGISEDLPIMQEEIFGPVLPVFTFTDISEPLSYVNDREKPLAFYFFGSDRQAKRALRETSSGGVCINDTLLHVAGHELPFGGVGNSGTGSYHGKRSFLAFSHERAVVTTLTWMDLPAKYAPFKGFAWMKRFLRG